MVNTQMSQMCTQNIANIFAGFWIRAGWVLREIHENECALNISTFTVNCAKETSWTSLLVVQSHYDQVFNQRGVQGVFLTL